MEGANPLAPFGFRESTEKGERERRRERMTRPCKGR